MPIGVEMVGDGGPDAKALSPHDASRTDSTLDAATPDDALVVDAAPDVGPVPDGGFKCPATKPATGASCSDIGLECEYGGDTNPACNRLFACSFTGWKLLNVASGCAHGTCPVLYAWVDAGTSCTPDGEICSYQAGTCTCAVPSSVHVVEGGLGVRWNCFPKQPNCPSPRPSIGSPCTMPNQSCDYGVCAGGVELECLDGVWTSIKGSCPS